ncbi:hypothetical protein HP436_00290 [Pseudomonas sp. CrR14]|nr:hypothetical protein [Pseudomonas sp. CrR14]
MSESELPNKHKFAVSADEFIRFLEDKTIESDCPACEGSDWTIIGDSSSGEPFRLRTMLKSESRTIGLSSYAIYCDNCGFIRQHLARVVRNWATENPPSQKEIDFGEEGDEASEQ